ncbi:MAG: hypothetical protein EXQ67_01735 [Thermoleophilia bacterium]|nr:hypothetical protein [Thermoleophilia bacterium]
MAQTALNSAMERHGDIHLRVENEEVDNGYFGAKDDLFADVFNACETLRPEDDGLALLELRHFCHTGS